MVVRGLEQTEKQSKHWISNDYWTKWNGMECVDPLLELLMDYRITVGIGGGTGTGGGTGAGAGRILTRSARVEETSMNEIQSIKQYSKLISIERTGMNQTDWHYQDREYLNTINIQYSEILSNVTERG